MSRYEIETSKIESNIEVIKKRAGVPVWGIIKFDGYSMGLEYMAGLLRKHGVDRFAVIEPEDVVRLRNAGFDEDVLFLRPVSDEETELLLQYDAIFCITSMRCADRVIAAAKKLGKKARGHIKLDVGLGRYGFTPAHYGEFSKLYTYDEMLSIEGIYSHFPAAFGPKKRTIAQYAAFENVLKRLEKDGIDRKMAHICNSAALFGFEGMRLDAVRTGSALLGRVAGVDAKAMGLERVGRLVSYVAEIKDLPAGSRTGYGNGKLVLRNTKAAIVPLGHWDGLGDSLGTLTVESGGKTFAAQMIETPSTGHVILNVTGHNVKEGDRVISDINPLRLNSAVIKTYI